MSERGPGAGAHQPDPDSGPSGLGPSGAGRSGSGPSASGPSGSGPSASGRGILLSVAPAATDLPHLLRTAIDAEQVGAARIHLAPDQPEVADAVTAIRAQTGLLVTADDGTPAADLADRAGPTFTELVLPETLSGPDLLVELARIIRDHPGPVSVGGHGSAALPVLLAALAVGLHIRVGTADLPPPAPTADDAAPPARHGPAGPPGPRDDIALIARAAGLARIAGRSPLPVPQARALLDLG